MNGVQTTCIGCDTHNTGHIWNGYRYCQKCWELTCLLSPVQTYTDGSGHEWQLTYKKSFCWLCFRRTLKAIHVCKAKNVKQIVCGSCS